MKIKANFDIRDLKDGQSRHPHLTPNKIYSVIGIEFDCYRIVNDEIEPILYPKKLFEVVDFSYPSNWIRTEFDDGEYYIEPPEFSEVGFFEDYFEGNSEAISIYIRYLEKNGLKR